MRPIFAVVLLMLLGSVQAAGKPLYRFVDGNGIVHYTDHPPSKNAKPLVIDKLGRLSKAPSTTQVALPAIPRFAVHFDTPTPGQVYYDETTAIPVALSVMPGLITGFGLRLKVDDENVSAAPLKELRATLPNLGAGTHVVVAVLLNAKGQELARSAPLKIHIQPRTAKN